MALQPHHLMHNSMQIVRIFRSSKKCSLKPLDSSFNALDPSPRSCWLHDFSKIIFDTNRIRINYCSHAIIGMQELIISRHFDGKLPDKIILNHALKLIGMQGKLLDQK
jgi:hypothetical protein